MGTERVQNETSAKIAEINDAFRKESYRHILLTQGVRERCDAMGVQFAVRHFSDFNENNDPYGEHDFGAMKLDGETIFWKIDYFDPSQTMWCDPLHPECERVLTVMLAEEY